MQRTNEQIGMRVSWITMTANAVLSVIKLIAGIFSNSGALLSDAVHSFSDVFSTVIVMIGIKMSNRKSDKEHQYGHDRFECVAAILLSIMLAVTGSFIGWAGIEIIISGNYTTMQIPGVPALIVAVISIVSKEAMYWYTRAAAIKINSGALKADAWHHRSDALSSIGAFIGILGARIAFPILDPIASIVICVFILKVAIDIFKDAIGKMTDKACDDSIVEEMRRVISDNASVCSIDSLETRIFGDKIYVDVEISADSTLTLKDAHDVAHQVHDIIENSFPKVKHCRVHVNPYVTEDTNLII